MYAWEVAGMAWAWEISKHFVHAGKQYLLSINRLRHVLNSLNILEDEGNLRRVIGFLPSDSFLL